MHFAVGWMMWIAKNHINLYATIINLVCSWLQSIQIVCVYGIWIRILLFCVFFFSFYVQNALVVKIRVWEKWSWWDQFKVIDFVVGRSKKLCWCWLIIVINVTSFHGISLHTIFVRSLFEWHLPFDMCISNECWCDIVISYR